MRRSLTRPRSTTLAAAALLLALVPVAAGGAPPGERRLTIFYTAEIHGTLEPCGCTSDPLGDIARYGALVEAARRDGTPLLLVDAGGLSYPEGGIPDKEKAADGLRAGFLASELGRMGVRAVGLGEPDLALGAAKLEPRRMAANLGAAPELEQPVVQAVGGIKVGILGVADPALGAGLKVRGEDPVPAAKREAEKLRKAGAEVVVALAPVDKPVARRLARDAGVDVVVLGRQVGRGLDRAESVGRGFVVAPADEMQKVGRIDLVLRGQPGASGPLADAGGPEANQARKAELGRALARLDGDLARWQAGGAGSSGADPTFIAEKKREREALVAEQARLEVPWSPPAQGSYFTNRLIPMSRSFPRDHATALAMRKLDARIAAVNLRAAAPPPPPEAGRASFVGMNKCASCHKAAVAFWNKTVHAHAWETLVEGGKQADYKCVGCHVTGYGQVGGSSLGHTRKLEDVQCETCHGPGSIHVAKEGLEEPLAIRRDTPDTTCMGCHNELHSDTFQYKAYLRDILGTGHGAAARDKLGDGPTGHSLRSAALAKAKVAGSSALKKM